MGLDETPAETTHDEMQRILATDLGIEPSDIFGWVIVIAVNNGDGQMRPALRTSVGGATAIYLMSSATSELTYSAISDPAHPDHGDVCDQQHDLEGDD